MSMNISLPKQMEAAVRARVSSGEYVSASEVIRFALRLLDERDKRIAALRDEVMIGYNQRHDAKSFTDETIEDIKRRGRERKAEGGNDGK